MCTGLDDTAQQESALDGLHGRVQVRDHWTDQRTHQLGLLRDPVPGRVRRQPRAPLELGGCLAARRAACENVDMSVAALEIGGRTIDAARLEDICTRYGIAELAVFGSVARGDATPASDVDVLYVLRPDVSLGFAIDDLEDELADVFGRRVDLVARKAVHPMLRPTIEEQARIVYAA